MIYFAQAVGGGAIKIGASVNVPARIKELENTYRKPLVLLGTRPGGGGKEERAIHERFSALRFGKTEQFRPDPELLDFIGRPLFVNAMPVVEPMENTLHRKGVALIVRGSDEWRTWLVELADHCRASVSELADDALAGHARRQGFTRKPPRR